MANYQDHEVPFGRPSKYRPEYCELLVQHMRQGLSFESFGAEVYAHKETLYQWVKRYPDFHDAKKMGTEFCRSFWERMGVAGAAGKIEGFNNATWIYNMKCRFSKEWRDIQQIQHTQAEPVIIKRLNGETIELTARKTEDEDE